VATDDQVIQQFGLPVSKLDFREATMHMLRHQLLRLALGIVIGCVTLSVQAALIFDGLGQRYTIQVLRQGQMVSTVSVPSGATLQVDADSVSVDTPDKIATFRGKVMARVKFADEVVFVVSAEEIRIVTLK
jgi:hypothetical protein